MNSQVNYENIILAPQFISTVIYLTVPLLMLAIGIGLTILVIVFFYRNKPYIGVEYQKKMNQKFSQRTSNNEEKVEKF